ncbi:methyltransferase [Iodidimonas nitroreducens]|uniref:Methyltransferase n=1 Tax=Iodidimonas nitroreducens TaxID=1236968 RepID=A0A5A7N661_9PROT|nr:class I SAM-dependent methyltransferase [Iodidimonas nitroreducens]GAK32405.1 bifunctional 3-demethylubiquinone-9 3-methyltransferase/ 2-octaprenyl-6-hydroxy phenol methylase [alpha proteobacterium Q-1]GER03204.1 methyltransferase [Iodidimonas nitroreducens]
MHKSKKDEAIACPLCGMAGAMPFIEIEGQAYHACEQCEIRFLHPRHHLPPMAEKAHYDQHENDVDDPGYRRFLARLLDPLLAYLDQNPAGQSLAERPLQALDFGCGPGPALAMMIKEAGHHCALYDPFFHPDQAAIDPGEKAGAYDIICCTEVAEHLYRPAQVFDQLVKLLAPQGVLAIMTCFQTDDARFAQWHYRRDPTHVIFYRLRSFHVLADRFGLCCHSPAKDVVFLKKAGQ